MEIEGNTDLNIACCVPVTKPSYKWTIQKIRYCLTHERHQSPVTRVRSGIQRKRIPKARIKLRTHGWHVVADKFRRREQGGHMALRQPHSFQGNVLCSILSNGSLTNHVFATAATEAVFGIGSTATFLPYSSHAPHRNALHVTTSVETLPIKNVISHADSGQTANVTAHILVLYDENPLLLVGIRHWYLCIQKHF